LAGLQAARARKQTLGRPKGLGKEARKKAKAAASKVKATAQAVTSKSRKLVQKQILDRANKLKKKIAALKAKALKAWKFLMALRKSAKACKTVKDCTAGSKNPAWTGANGFWKYVHETTDKKKAKDGKISQVQAFWQNNLGYKMNYMATCGTIVRPLVAQKRTKIAKSIVKGNSASKINCALAHAIEKGEFRGRYLNFVTIDNAASCGKRLAYALKRKQLVEAVRIAIQEGSLV